MINYKALKNRVEELEETIKAKDAEIEYRKCCMDEDAKKIKLASEMLEAKDKAIAEARDLIEKLSFYTKRVCGENRLDLDLKRECLEKAKAWLEENK